MMANDSTEAVKMYDVMGRPVAVRYAPGSEPAVLLLHGAGGNHDTLGRLADALGARGVAAYAPSLPGRCGSDGPPPATVAESAGWVAALMDELGLERAPLLLGHSYGGAITLELALRHPDRLAGLVLVATGARLKVNPVILQLMQEAADRGVPADAGRMAWSPDADPALVDEAAAVGRRTPPQSALADWLAVNAFDRLGDMAAVALPTLVLAGAQDVLTPTKYTNFLAEHIAGAQLTIVEGAGHMLPMERPDEVAQSIADFRASL